jgi:hypothetical protein
MTGLVWRLAQDWGGRRVEFLEIGSWNGGSTLIWGEALALYSGGGCITCVDPWQAYFDLDANPNAIYREMNDALERGTVYADFVANMELMADKIDVRILRGYSQDVLPTLAGNTYDLIYIDGDHTYDATRSDIALAKSLVSEGGVLCGDDLEIQVNEADSKLVLECPTEDYVHLARYGRDVHLGVTLAVDAAFGPVSAWAGFWAMRKTASGWAPISLAGMPMHVSSFLDAAQLLKLKQFLMESGRY